MTGEEVHIACLRQLPSGNSSGQSQLTHRLSNSQRITIGRDPRCQIVLDSAVYAGVSRRHAEIRPARDNPADDTPVWWVCDLNSANGTFVNGQMLQGCRVLRPGDRIVLGQNGPEFVFESNVVPELPAQVPHAVVATPSSGARLRDGVTLSQLFPIFSTGRELTRKAYLIPATITIGFVVVLFAAIGEPALFNLLLAAYLSTAAYYFIYQLCGKHKPWWLLLGVALATMAILSSPLLGLSIFIFRQILPGQIPSSNESVNFLLLLIRMFFGAGLMEELLKALPILALQAFAQRLKAPWRQRLGVEEPLDGILLGAASAIGFTLLETLGQYVPEITQNATLQAGEGVGQLVGLQLLIPRLLGAVAGHLSYSGYLGYFIGLSALRPSRRWLILGVGYLTAASLHALWNACGTINPIILASVGGLSYAFLGAAILKARSLSPNRSDNFATRLR